MHRTPLQDWLLRAWRAGHKFAFSDTVTVLMFRTQYQKRYSTNEGTYSRFSAEHNYIGELLDTETANAIRRLVAADIASSPIEDPYLSSRNWKWSTRLKHTFFTPLAAGAYYVTGADLYSTYQDLRGYDKNARIRNLLAKRVGESVPDAIDIESIVNMTLHAKP
jgi:hypothetical protein